MSKIEIDPSFVGSGRSAKRRRRNRIIRRLGLVFGAVGLLGAVLFAGIYGLSHLADGAANRATEYPNDDDVLSMVQSDDAAEGGIQLAAASEAFLDIRGAPMIIVLPEGDNAGTRRIVLKKQIDPNRARQGDELRLIEDVLLDATQRVQLTLPSSSADLAAFQSRRQTAIAPDGRSDVPTVATEVVEQGARVTVDANEGSWGEILDDEVSGLENTISYVETVIKNTTTDAAALDAKSRVPLFNDQVVWLEEERALKQILTEKGVQPAEVDRLLSALESQSGVLGIASEKLTKLPKGGLVAMRLDTRRFGAQVLQISIYDNESYILSLAQPGPGRFEQSADPWFSADLRRRAGNAVRARGAQGEINLKDAIYSTAIRNGLPAELVGEMMVMLSRKLDLDRIATQKDRLQIIATQETRSIAPAGQILFVALTGGGRDFSCYVLQPRDRKAPYGCYDPNDGPMGGGAAGSPMGGGFLLPVAGTKTSGFGPRFHPILNRTLNHNGVDWAAPTGTPVKAVAAGKVSRADKSPSYGNIIYLDHAGGAQSRYAHLNAFATGLKLGDRVTAGQLIGYVGTTGRSTGPHLHFELRINGRPVDPLALGAARASGAVEALVSQIIRVESAGNARAKNTRSSATGLGQFINSTWLRMMRTYRPDLVKTMSTEALLELRFDPALSRAMVTNLARENEAFLRARGHAITPGRLYLAHFLGPAGAHTALSSSPSASVLDIMGAGVVKANPFLSGWTIGQMTAWSDRKMSRVKGGSATIRTPAAPRIEPAEVKRYKKGIQELLASL